jgi:acyl phosphate:glycerol-3-phosphate acyltransferase
MVGTAHPTIFLMIFAITFALLIGAYLLGSFPTGYLAGRLLKGIDIREHGSGSTGATNVLRTLGKVPGSAVLLTDVFKGVAAVSLVQVALRLNPLPEIQTNLSLLVVGTAAMAILGHSKSVWLGWKGGKSVATGLGVLLAMNWQVALLTLGVFGISIGITRIVSISSIFGALAVAVLMFIYHQPTAYVIFTAVGGAYVIWLHRANIQRLLNGTEPQLGKASSTSSDSTQQPS